MRAPPALTIRFTGTGFRLVLFKVRTRASPGLSCAKSSQAPASRPPLRPLQPPGISAVLSSSRLYTCTGMWWVLTLVTGFKVNA